VASLTRAQQQRVRASANSEVPGWLSSPSSRMNHSRRGLLSPGASMAITNRSAFGISTPDCQDFTGLTSLAGAEVSQYPGWGERPAMATQRGGGVLCPRVSVVIPTLNEARNLPHVFARLPKGLHEVIVVDGHSVDDTLAVARRLRPDVRIVLQTRRGKGNALACGFAAASGDVIAMVDADGSADPHELPQFIRALLDGADFAKGTRFAAGGGSSDITRLRGLGNRVLSTLFNLCYRTRYSDLCYGFNVFWRHHADLLGLDATSPPPDGCDGRLWGDGFEIETLIHIRIAKTGLIVAEVPSFEHSRIHGVSNLSAVSDGIRVLRTILRERRRTRKRTATTDTRSLPESRGPQPAKGPDDETALPPSASASKLEA
jgi:hypothetical protein